MSVEKQYIIEESELKRLEELRMELQYMVENYPPDSRWAMGVQSVASTLWRITHKKRAHLTAPVDNLSLLSADKEQNSD